MERIKPCPFCGARGGYHTTILSSKKILTHRIKCMGKHCVRMYSRKSKEDVLLKWNTRKGS